jgi:hypothetical protein
MSQDMKAKGYKVTGISNKVDGSEDDILWHQSNEESCQMDVTDNELTHEVYRKVPGLLLL